MRFVRALLQYTCRHLAAIYRGILATTVVCLHFSHFFTLLSVCAAQAEQRQQRAVLEDDRVHRAGQCRQTCHAKKHCHLRYSPTSFLAQLTFPVNNKLTGGFSGQGCPTRQSVSTASRACTAQNQDLPAVTPALLKPTPTKVPLFANNVTRTNTRVCYIIMISLLFLV